MHFVKSVIDNWDPIDLLFHAPENEYHSEIEKIQYLLGATDNADELAEGILKIFTEAFGKEVFNKTKDECKQIAHMLLFKKY